MNRSLLSGRPDRLPFSPLDDAWHDAGSLISSPHIKLSWGDYPRFTGIAGKLSCSIPELPGRSLARPGRIAQGQRSRTAMRAQPNDVDPRVASRLLEFRGDPAEARLSPWRGEDDHAPECRRALQCCAESVSLAVEICESAVRFLHGPGPRKSSQHAGHDSDG